ncbi:DUF6090 family protein [Mariniflexile sp. AS56]|uniref:DUF6090 family protein n=1 Tax=Mariniflexile sp. AS56 TaxID=3063957 RepID=UPI0026EFC9CF|nr:DUF6090 family protein [Mariniflexile sp. AS56]MDO7173536.1 DUF6090 family protein [Mariniflexile sp. AS56]
MIKIFRKIRQRLLTESKFGNYFVYALGEIFLVVIGILIALKINNWNEIHKTDKVRNGYYSQLLQDLEKDKIYINTIKKKMDSSVLKYNDYRDSFNKPNLTAVEILHNQNKLNYKSKLIRFHSNTISTLENTGDIKLLPSEIRNILIDLKQLQELTIKTAEFNDQGKAELLRSAMIEYGSMDLIESRDNQSKLATFYNNEHIRFKKIMSLEAAQQVKNDSERDIVESFEQMLIEIDRITNLIQQKLN